MHSLSLTSRSIYQSLTQYARHLKTNSLRCAFDTQPLLSDLRKAVEGTHISIDHADSRSASNEIHLSQPGQLSSAFKISHCARDMVTGCRRCNTIVCRNCVAKPPSNRWLGDRHRRLCRICLDAPLSAHLQPLKEDAPLYKVSSRASSNRSTRSASGSSFEEDESEQPVSDLDLPVKDAFTSNAFLRTPCVCPSEGVYLCAACGHNLRANDTTYKRVWTWRSRYSTHIGGGLGTGLGVGNQGQKCGRGDHCLSTSSSSISWVEIDCSDGALMDSDAEFLPSSRVATPVGDRHNTGSPAPATNKPGYFSQEIEGIGGVVKKKVKKRVKVGATVLEYDDERISGKYLDREASGRERSWCGWCDRVCLGENDRQLQ